MCCVMGNITSMPKTILFAFIIDLQKKNNCIKQLSNKDTPAHIFDHLVFLKSTEAEAHIPFVFYWVCYCKEQVKLFECIGFVSWSVN